MPAKIPPRHARPGCLSFLLPRLEDVLFAALFFGIVATGPVMLNGDGDLGRHITIGNYILDSGRIPTQDLFSYTLAGQPLTPHEWLAQVVFAFSHRFLGLDGVVLLCALLLALAVTGVYLQAVQRSGLRLISMGLAIAAAAAAALHWLARPHLWTMLWVVLWVGTLEGLRRGQYRLAWILPVLMVAWANLHGAFIAGFVIWGLYGVGAFWERVWGPRESRPAVAWWRAWGLGGAGAFLGSLLNPVGWHLWETSLGYLRNRYLVDHTFEYFSPNFHLGGTWPFLGWIAFSLLLLGVGWLRLRPTSALLLAAWTVMGLYSARNIPLYALLAAPILAEGLAAAGVREAPSLAGYVRLEGRLQQVEAGLRGHLVALACLLLVGWALAKGIPLDFAGQGNRFSEKVFPVEAVSWLDGHPLPGEGFNHFPWGGYLLYRRWPAQRVFIDGQTDFYGEALTRQYEQVIGLAPAWQEVLQRYGVRWAILPPGSSLEQALVTELGWQAVYRDDTAVILAPQEETP